MFGYVRFGLLADLVGHFSLVELSGAKRTLISAFSGMPERPLRPRKRTFS